MTGQRFVGGDRLDLQVGMREGQPVVVLQDGEDVPPGQVLTGEPLADRPGTVVAVNLCSTGQAAAAVVAAE